MRRALSIAIATAVVSVGSLVVTPQAQAAFSFLPVENYAVASPSQVKGADLNGDAFTDIVASNPNSASIGIVKNDGDGTFTATDESTVGATVSCARNAHVDVGNLDSNNPGDVPDIVTSCAGSPATLLGDGTGAFADPIANDAFSMANSTTLGHFDSSGPGLDVVHAGYGGTPGNFVYPFCGSYGDGDGTFSNGACLTEQPGEIIPADIHETGQDVPIFPSDDVVRFVGYSQAVPGGWTSGSTRPTGSRNAKELATGDIDGDGDLDLVVANLGDQNTISASLSVLKYDAGAGFYPDATPQVTTTQLYPSDLALGDFDDDGHLDAAVVDGSAWTTDFARATLAIFGGNGDGTFDAPQLFAAGMNGTGHTLVADDFDADGTDDVAIGVYGGNRVEVYRSGAVAPPPADTLAPETTITSGPKTTIRTNKKKVTVRFTFSANEASTFRCSMDGAPYATCVSGVTYTVGRGSHQFRVYATDTAGNADLTPAPYPFKVRRR